MFTLYYAPGACSMAAHILLEEGGERFELRKVDLTGEQHTEEYLRINPLGMVPVLGYEDGETLAENTAILPYLGKRFGLWPTEPRAEAKALSVLGYFATGVHQSHARIRRPERYTVDESALTGIKEMGLEAFHRHLKKIDQQMAGREWLLEKYSAVDPYAFVFYSWGIRRELPMTELKNYTAFKDRMIARPAVQRVLAQEKITM